MVSIITPNYNGAKYIAETIRSVMAQTYENWELIIVDDGSTDDSENVVAPFLSEKVFFLHRPEARVKGGNTCRNIGIENAKGEYLMFLDSDDLLAPFCLEQRVAALRKYKDNDFIVFNMRNFVKDVDDGTVFTRLKTNNPLNHFLGQDCIWQTSAPIWRTEFVKKIGMFNERYPRLQDPEMVVRALNYDGVSFLLMPESKPDAYYRKTLKEGNGKYGVIYKSLCMFIEDFFPTDRASLDAQRSIFYLLCFSHFLYSTNDEICFSRLCGRIGYGNCGVLPRIFVWICKKNELCAFLRKTVIKKLFCWATFKLHKMKIND